MTFRTWLEAQGVSIDWQVPDLTEEVGEYFENPATYNWLKARGYQFRNKQQLMAFLRNGHLQVVPKETLAKTGSNLTLTVKDFQKELQDQDYRASYRSMEQTLLKDRAIKLPAPILLHIGDEIWGFAGNRRMNLAWNYRIPVKFWVVKG